MKKLLLEELLGSTLSENFIRRILNVLYKIVTVEEYEVSFENSELIKYIYKYLSTDMGLENEDITRIIILFIVNYEEDIDFINVPILNRIEILTDNIQSLYESLFDDHRILVLSEHLQISPFLIEPTPIGTHYGITTFSADGDEYGIGTEQEMDGALEEWYDSYYGQYDDLSEIVGADALLNYLYIDDTTRRTIADEDSTNRSDNLDEEEILEQMRSLTDDYSRIEYLIKKYDELKRQQSEDEDFNQENQMSHIIEKGRSILQEIYYDETYESLDDLEEYLYEQGYISKDRYGNKTINDLENLLNWLSFDENKFKEDMIGDADFDVLFDNGTDWTRYDGVRYYIGKID